MPLTGAVAAGAGAIGSVLGQFIGARQSRRNVRDTHRLQMEREAEAHGRNVELWERQMAYNHPQQQMQRFEDAGLNPHLIYGQGTPGQAETPPQRRAPEADFSGRRAVDPFTMLANYQDISMKRQVLEHEKRKTQLTAAQAGLTDARHAKVMNEATILGLESTIAQYITDHKAGDLEDIAKGRIGGMKAEDWLKRASAEIREWEAGLTRQNIHPRDSLLMRQLFDMLQSIGFTPRQLRENIPGIFRRLTQ